MADKSRTYELVKQESRDHGERRDCTVVAMTATTGLPYGVCRAAAEKQGRRQGKGMPIPSMRKALESLGFEMKVVAERKWNGRESVMQGAFYDKTVLSWLRTIRLPVMTNWARRKFILSSSGHVAGWNGKELVDWSNGRRLRLLRIYEVVPTVDRLAQWATKGEDDV